uniref:Uncharacterized protein n=1 Tax=Rhizophora mucronata TaxID=61149 RepID=A0A2P2R373_RHIMU
MKQGKQGQPLLTLVLVQ